MNKHYIKVIELPKDFKNIVLDTHTSNLTLLSAEELKAFQSGVCGFEAFLLRSKSFKEMDLRSCVTVIFDAMGTPLLQKTSTFPVEDGTQYLVGEYTGKFYFIRIDNKELLNSFSTFLVSNFAFMRHSYTTHILHKQYCCDLNKYILSNTTAISRKTYPVVKASYKR